MPKLIACFILKNIPSCILAQQIPMRIRALNMNIGKYELVWWLGSLRIFHSLQKFCVDADGYVISNNIGGKFLIGHKHDIGGFHNLDSSNPKIV